MSDRKINGFLASGLTALLATAPVSGDADLRTIPEKMHSGQPAPVWVADGVTEYSAQVHLDNTGLGGSPTDGVQWGFQNTPGFNFISAELPTSNDFYEGIPMGFEIIEGPGGLSGRNVFNKGDGPVDHQGNLGTYNFTVAPGTTPGLYAFNLTETILLDDSFPFAQPQPHTITNEEVYVAPINPADFHFPPEIERDGYINNADAQFFFANMDGPGYSSPADIDGNGEADLNDLARLQRCYTGTEPVSSETCD